MPTVSRAAAPARTRVRAVPVRPILTAIVLVSTGAEALLARLRLTPSAFPDEYVYSQLARSLASGGRLRVRGVSAHFPALLEPLLTAPVWFVHDVGTAYRLVQLENAFVMSLAAIPAYLIARRLGVAAGMSLAVAALAVAGPQLLFVAMIESEPFAYPLALGAVAASIAVIERPTLRGQVLLLVLSALATLARLQLAVLPLCAAVAIVVAGLRAGRVRDALREQRLLLAVIGAGAVAGVAVAFVHGFGYYHLAPTVSGPGRALRMAGVDLYVVLLGAGAALVPSALVGIWLALARPRSRGELAFGAVAVMVAAALVLQCVLWGDTQLVQERYLGYLFPLVALGFALRASRRPRRWVPELGVAAALAGVAALVPLSGYAIDASHSEAPLLYAFDELQSVTLHSSSGAAAVFALGATALAAIGVACTRGGRRSFVPVGLALATSVALLAGAAAWAAKTNAIARAIYLPSDAAWVDHAAGGPATLVVTAGDISRRRTRNALLEPVADARGADADGRVAGQARRAACPDRPARPPERGRTPADGSAARRRDVHDVRAPARASPRALRERDALALARAGRARRPRPGPASQRQPRLGRPDPGVGTDAAPRRLDRAPRGRARSPAACHGAPRRRRRDPPRRLGHSGRHASRPASRLRPRPVDGDVRRRGYRVRRGRTGDGDDVGAALHPRLRRLRLDPELQWPRPRGCARAAKGNGL